MSWSQSSYMTHEHEIEGFVASLHEVLPFTCAAEVFVTGGMPSQAWPGLAREIHRRHGHRLLRKGS